MPETVVSSCIEVAAAGAGEHGVCEGEEVDRGVVSGGACGGSAVYLEVLGAEYQRQGGGARPVVAGNALAAGHSFSSVGGHGDRGKLWCL